MNAFSRSKVKQTIANETFTIFIRFLIILLISSSWSFINLLQMKAIFISLLVFGISYICILLALIHHIWLYLIIFNWSRDNEKNPEPKPNSYKSFSICHWNLNSISMHNVLKLSFLRAYIIVHKFDVICLSETYLDSSILHEDNNLQIPVYDLHREDHPLNVKQGVFTTTSLFYWKLKIFITCRNTLILRQKSKATYVIHWVIPLI